MPGFLIFGEFFTEHALESTLLCILLQDNPIVCAPKNVPNLFKKVSYFRNFRIVPIFTLLTVTLILVHQILQVKLIEGERVQEGVTLKLFLLFIEGLLLPFLVTEPFTPHVHASLNALVFQSYPRGRVNPDTVILRKVSFLKMGVSRR